LELDVFGLRENLSIDCNFDIHPSWHRPRWAQALENWRRLAVAIIESGWNYNVAKFAPGNIAQTNKAHAV
jgi:hypothetical protein